MTCCAGSLPGRFVSGGLESQRVEEIRRQGRAVANGQVVYTMAVPAVHCGACVSAIERALLKLPAVKIARVNLTLRNLTVTLENGEADIAPVIARLDDLGYQAMSLENGGQEKQDQAFAELVRSLAVAGFAAANIMLLSVSVWTGAAGVTRDLFHYISALIAIPAVAYAGQPFFRSAVTALASRRMNMDVPISLGVILATVMSLYESARGGEHAYFDAAVSLLFFLLVGRTLDHMMRARARHLASQLARMSAKGGMVIGADGSATYTPIDEIAPDMVLRVAAGERIPVDGIVSAGSSEIDRSLVTGESAPARLSCGDHVEAGAMNLTGALEVRVMRRASESFLADVQEMMAAAEQGRGRYVRIADRMARMYAPAVHVLAFVSFAGWMLWTGGDWHQSLTVAVSVLIITCPCALGLAVPVAHVVSASRLFQAGILMKDGAALERLAEVDTAVFDKTGTLTTGEPRVTSCTIPEGRMQAIARSLAAQSRHPASLALAAYLKPQGTLGAVAVADLEEVAGFGIRGLVEGREVRLGRASWVGEIAGSAASSGGGIAFAVAGEPAAQIELAEELRAGARDTIQLLENQGMPCELLSGDAKPAVAKIATALGLRRFSASLRPADKLNRLSELAEQGHKVLMVGDGLNDAPALAAAHASIAPSSASDIGRNAADFVFTRGDLTAVGLALRVARQTQRVVKENFGLAIVYNVFAVPLAMLGMLNPLIAAVAMSTSSIIVVGNSLRLFHVNGERRKEEGTSGVSPSAPATHATVRPA